ncbi:hypothetical protein [Nonomuraea ceibae]|uniref:hypothetical protein n=1 Tax=Nonomuraea ceibae TaxID=1935170 RepID=UPI001C60742D|nr:hypothetical protein [Nonomuraea ceibae]
MRASWTRNWACVWRWGGCSWSTGRRRPATGLDDAAFCPPEEAAARLAEADAARVPAALAAREHGTTVYRPSSG